MKSAKVWFVALSFISALSAGAENLCVGNQPVPLRSGIAGSMKAQIYPGACAVSSGEEREGWVRVTVEGWVEASVFSKRNSAAPRVAVPTVGAVELVKSQIVEGARDLMGKATRVQVVITIRNTTNAPIVSWSGILAAKNSRGEFPLRNRVSGDSPIAAGALAEERYGWESGDPLFELLTGPEAKTLEFSLNQVAVK